MHCFVAGVIINSVIVTLYTLWNFVQQVRRSGLSFTDYARHQSQKLWDSRYWKFTYFLAHGPSFSVLFMALHHKYGHRLYGTVKLGIIKQGRNHAKHVPIDSPCPYCVSTLGFRRPRWPSVCLSCNAVSSLTPHTCWKLMSFSSFNFIANLLYSYFGSFHSL